MARMTAFAGPRHDGWLAGLMALTLVVLLACYAAWYEHARLLVGAWTPGTPFSVSFQGRVWTPGDPAFARTIPAADQVEVGQQEGVALWADRRQVPGGGGGGPTIAPADRLEAGAWGPIYVRMADGRLVPLVPHAPR